MHHIIVVFIIVLCVVVFIYRLNEDYTHPMEFQIGKFPLETQPDDITCGPTSVLMVLRKYGLDTNLDEVKKKTYTEWFSYNGKKFGMTPPENITFAFRKFEFPVKQMFGNEKKLKHFVSQNKPVIVLLRSDKYIWHYVVVVGFTDKDFSIADPANGTIYKISTDDFLNSWSFETNMKGLSVTNFCTLCKGTGKWLEYSFGPIGLCEICNGSGKEIDYMRGLVKAADIYPMTMFVPEFESK